MRRLPAGAGAASSPAAGGKGSEEAARFGARAWGSIDSWAGVSGGEAALVCLDWGGMEADGEVLYGRRRGNWCGWMAGYEFRAHF
jgi:hypothetical protein